MNVSPVNSIAGASALRLVSVLLVVLAACGMPCDGASDPAAAVAARAKQLLDDAGVRGGFVVHLGCGAGEFTAALRISDVYVVHGLDTDQRKVDEARDRLRSLGVFGPVAVELARGHGLPYADNLVNLVVVEDRQLATRDEILRVLAPAGVACVWEAGKWNKFVKPRPDNIDEWSHALHDASNNALAKDTVVGPPQSLQWIAGPANSRHHEHLASVTVVVSSAGRLFSIVDEGPAASVLLPAKWSLIARDAFSGVLLWRRPIATWESHLATAQNGPAALSRRLVASSDRVYVTLGIDAGVAALDAASGKTVQSYPGTEHTEEMLHSDGRLFLLVGGDSPQKAAATDPPAKKTIVVVDARTGEHSWQKPGVLPAPLSLGVAGGRVFYLDEAVVCLDAVDGRELWRAPRATVRRRPAWSAATLVAHQDVVLCGDREPGPPSTFDQSTGKKLPQWLADGGAGGLLVAYSAKTGEVLWSCRCGESYHAPADVFVNGDLVWVGQSRARHGPDYTVARDLRTGQVRQRISPEEAFATTMPHHRCYRDRATSRYLLAGRTGIEFIDQQTGEAQPHHWVRGVCQYGIVPCNGLLYVPPHSCACYIESKLTGFLALSPATSEQAFSSDGRHERGPAYEAPLSRPSVSADPGADEWPVYRHDSARSGSTRASLPTRWACHWQSSPGGRLTSPVIAEGLVLVASVDAHTVHALDAQRGTAVWRYAAGGRIDSPPSVARGRVVFGSADGAIYCLRAQDGQLAWRFRAAPQDRRLVAFDQVESAWPVSGSVLVQGDIVYAVAGRSSYIDHGLYLYRLDLKTGERLSEQRVSSRDPSSGAQSAEPRIFEMPGALPDVLSSDGRLVYMRHLAFDRRDLSPQKPAPHLYSPAGFLNADWWHRSYWIFGEHFYSGYLGWYFAGREVPAGRLLSIAGAAIYGFACQPQFYSTTTAHRYHLFALDKSDQPAVRSPDSVREAGQYNQRAQEKPTVKFRWQKEVPLLARAMLLAGEELVLCGPPTDAAESEASLPGKNGGLLCVVAAKDGQSLREHAIDALPVFDGLAAADGRLYLSTEDGRLICWGDASHHAGLQELPRRSRVTH